MISTDLRSVMGRVTSAHHVQPSGSARNEEAQHSWFPACLSATKTSVKTFLGIFTTAFLYWIIVCASVALMDFFLLTGDCLAANYATASVPPNEIGIFHLAVGLCSAAYLLLFLLPIYLYVILRFYVRPVCVTFVFYSWLEFRLSIRLMSLIVYCASSALSVVIEFWTNYRIRRWLRKLESKKSELEKEIHLSNNENYTPQSLSSLPHDITSAAYKAVVNMSGVTDHVKDSIINFVLLVGTLSGCNTETSFLCALLAYAKTHYDGPLYDKVKNVIENMSSTSSDVKMGPQSAERPEWVNLMKTSLTDWKLVVHNPGFKKLSKVISMLVAVNAFDGDNFNLSVGNLEFFSVGAYDRQVTAMNFIDALFETVVHFSEGAYKCFEEGSIKPLVMSSTQAFEMEQYFMKIVTMHDYARSGNLEKLAEVDEATFDKLLDDTIELFQRAAQTTSAVIERRVLTDRWRELMRMKSDFASSRVRGGLRIAPWAFCIFGRTSVGKSSLTDYIMISVLHANGFACSSDHICTLNAKDERMDNMRSYITGIKLDDVAQATAESYKSGSPLDVIIDLVNNVRMCAIMADMVHKGKVSIEPMCVAITTNVKNLMAPFFSNEPLAVLRRCPVHITARIKPEYCEIEPDGTVSKKLDGALLDRDFPDPSIFPDVWLLDLEYASSYEIPHKPDGLMWKYHRDKKGNVLRDVDVNTAISFMLDLSESHYKKQKRLLEKTSDMDQKLTFCEACKRPKACCNCKTPQIVTSDMETVVTTNCTKQCKLSPQSGETSPTVIRQLMNAATPYVPDTIQWVNGIAKRIPPVGNVLGTDLFAFFRPRLSVIRSAAIPLVRQLETLSSVAIIGELHRLEASYFTSWHVFVPQVFYDNEKIKSVIEFLSQDAINQDVKAWYRSAICVWLTLCSTMFVYIRWQFIVVWAFVGVVFLMCCHKHVVETAQERYYEEIVKRRDALPEVAKRVRDNHLTYVLKAFAIVAGVYTVYKTFQVLKTNFMHEGSAPHGNLLVKNPQDIADRDAEVNPWKKFKAEPLPVSRSILTTSWTQGSDKIIRNLYHMTTTIENGSTKSCDALFLDTNVAIFPRHMLPTRTCKASFLKREVELSNSTFTNDLCPSKCVSIPDTDFALGYFSACGSLKNIVQLFPETKQEMDVPVKMVYRNDLGKLEWNKFMVSVREGVSNGIATFFGSYYTTQTNTFEGLCMAVAIADLKIPMIVTLHLGGLQNTTAGCGGFVSQNQLNIALKQIYRDPLHMQCASHGVVPHELYGKTIVKDHDIHPRSAVNFLTGNTNIDFLASLTSNPTYRSDVIDTPITAFVDEVCGVPNKWGPPKLRSKGSHWPFQTSLEVCSKPSVGVDPQILEIAYGDYKKVLVKMFTEQKSVWSKQIKPLDVAQTICGLDGKRFLDRMPTGTSMGIPWCKTKLDFLEPGEPRDDITDPLIPIPVIMEEVVRAEAIYLAGDRYMAIFGASLKDEPTLLTKDKVRVFQAAPFVLQFMIRKYFLPVARMISMNPLMSECAVGINAAGPEWAELNAHITQFGLTRIIAGDYSKYDLRMPAQLTLCAFQLMIDIAELSGNYTDDDLKIMRGVVTDVCYPLVAFNGDLLMFRGTNPSGQNMTVYINSIVNSLLHRCAYYSILGVSSPPFQEVCALTTYGDDAKGSVKEGYDEFNHVSMAKYLESVDIIFTMPDKTSDPVPYMLDSQADFLKRKNRFDPDLNTIVGMLGEDSIFKNLHAIKNPKFPLTPIVVVAGNIDQDLGEWFFHGKEVYELRQKQMIHLTELFEISHMVKNLHMTHAERVDAWKLKYVKSE